MRHFMISQSKFHRRHGHSLLSLMSISVVEDIVIDGLGLLHFPKVAQVVRDPPGSMHFSKVANIVREIILDHMKCQKLLTSWEVQVIR